MSFDPFAHPDDADDGHPELHLVYDAMYRFLRWCELVHGGDMKFMAEMTNSLFSGLAKHLVLTRESKNEKVSDDE